MTSEVRDRVTSPVRVREWFAVFAAVSTLPVWWLVLAWYKFMGRRDGHPWVMSGHRGRLKGDSAGALFDYIRDHTDQAVVWLANDADHTTSMVRNSWRARLAIARAPVLIYSHGEDDLDLCLALCRRLLGYRINLGHGANLVKRGSMHPQVLKGVDVWRRKISAVSRDRLRYAALSVGLREVLLGCESSNEGRSACCHRSKRAHGSLLQSAE